MLPLLLGKQQLQQGGEPQQQHHGTTAAAVALWMLLNKYAAAEAMLPCVICLFPIDARDPSA